MNEFINRMPSGDDPFAGMTEDAKIAAVAGMTETSHLDSLNVQRNPNTGRIVKMDDVVHSDEALNVTFTIEPEFSRLQTYLNKGQPTYVDVEYITIHVPGQERGAESNVHEPITEYYKWRFPQEYARFKAGLSEQVHGTPLSAWTALSPSFRKALENSGVKTVEQLASLSDSAASTIPSFHTWKAKANDFVKITRDAAEASHLQAKLDAVQDSSNARIAALEAQIAQLIELQMSTLPPQTIDAIAKPERKEKAK